MNNPVTKNGKGWLYGYGFTLLLHLAAIAAGWPDLRFITKPLLMALLLVYFLKASAKSGTSRYLVMSALVFSWLGDVFLMNGGNSFFTAGLSAFLTAHLFYILYFSGIRRKQSPRKPWNIILLAVLALYVGIFYFFLGPSLDAALKIPVFLYAIVIATMFAMAWHSGETTTGVPADSSVSGASTMNPAAWFIMGAAFFIISDSLLAINAFLQPFSGASLWVMSTYGIAQVCIIRGAVQTESTAANS